MKVLFLSPQWGHEHLPLEDFISKVLLAGYDGLDTWMPQKDIEKKQFLSLLQQFNIPIVCHQHQANGRTIEEFCKSFEYYLHQALECNPIMINSHSGRDYFDIDDQLRVIDTAFNFSAKYNVSIAHETHRGRIAYSPYETKKLFDLRPEMRITADFSHWTCVTESYLENIDAIVDEAILRTEHVHARIGFTQGPQVPDPRAEEWKMSERIFMNWWSRIIDSKLKEGRDQFTITPEFGPAPYMLKDPKTNLPLSDQWEINCYVKDKIKELLV